MSKINHADIIRRRYNKMVELSRPVFEQKEVNRALYSSTMEVDDSYEYDYTLSDPHIFPIMRNYLARSNPSLTKVRLEPRNYNDYEKRQINQDIVNWELNEILLTNLLYKIYYSGFMNGKGYYKTGWLYEPAVNVQSDGDVQRVMRDITNRADAKFVRFQDILVPNQNIPTLREQPYYIELIQQRVGEMLDENERLEESGQKPYWDKKWLKELKDSGVEKKLLDYQTDIVQEGDSDNEFAFRSAYVAMVCMHTLEGDVFYLPLESLDRIVNTDRTNRYWHGHYPVADFTPFLEDDNYYALGIVDVTADLQIAASEILNQALTNLRQSNNSMWVAASPAAQTPDYMFRNRPDGVIRVVGDASQIQQIRSQDTSRSAMNMSTEIQNRIERASGISSLYSSGAPGTSINQTARGAQIIDQNIDTNMRMIVDLFGEQVIKVMAQDFLELNPQYITEEQTFYITGQKGVRDIVTTSPETISANFDVFVNAERMVKQTPASRQASLQNLMTQLSTISTQAQLNVDLIPIVEALVDSYPEMENVADVVVSVDEKGKRDIAMLERGQLPEIKVRDQHAELIQLVSIHFEDNGQSYSPEVQEIFQKYIEDHLRFLESAQEVQQLAQPQMPVPMGAANLEDQMLGPDQAGIPNQGYNLGKIV